MINPRLVSINSELGISSQFLAVRGFRECDEASYLEVAEVGGDGKTHMMAPGAANAWRRLNAAAIADGISLFIVSAFRSIDRQTEIIRRKLEVGMAIEDILAVCAPPGFSEHHTGRAVDLSTPGCRLLEIVFEHTRAFAWLSTRGAEFGYHLSYPNGNHHGYQYEPWHWCFNDASIIPADTARRSHTAPLNSNLTFPEKSL